jgi:hypothetical protein
MTSSTKRVRSPKFPFIDLQTAIQRADAFYKSEKRNSASVPVALKTWDYNDKSSGGLQTISALKEFGLMEDSGSKDARRVKLTDRALRIILDTREDSPERDRLVQDAALLPNIHCALWEQYGRELPSDSNLRHYLMFDYEPPFNENSVDGFIAQFRSTLAYAKLTTSDTISSEAEDKGTIETSDEPEAEMQEVRQDQQNVKSLGRTPVGSDIPVAPDCIMGVNATGRVTQGGIEKLIAYLQLIKGSFPQNGEA